VRSFPKIKKLHKKRKEKEKLPKKNTTPNYLRPPLITIAQRNAKRMSSDAHIFVKLIRQM
jgi:hypothetical protein